MDAAESDPEEQAKAEARQQRHRGEAAAFRAWSVMEGRFPPDSPEREVLNRRLSPNPTMLVDYQTLTAQHHEVEKERRGRADLDARYREHFHNVVTTGTMSQEWQELFDRIGDRLSDQPTDEQRLAWLEGTASALCRMGRRLLDQLGVDVVAEEQGRPPQAHLHVTDGRQMKWQLAPYTVVWDGPTNDAFRQQGENSAYFCLEKIVDRFTDSYGERVGWDYAAVIASTREVIELAGQIGVRVEIATENAKLLEQLQHDALILDSVINALEEAGYERGEGSGLEAIQGARDGITLSVAPTSLS